MTVRNPFRRTFIPMLAMVIGAGFCAQPATAQYGEAAGLAEAMNPEYLSRDIVLFDQDLNLDETQRVIIETLYQDYSDSFEEGLERMRQRYDAMRSELETTDRTRVLRVIFGPIEQWSDEKAVIGDQFLDSVKTVLTQDQLDLWPAFERRLYREKNLYRGKLMGESLNLFNVIRDLHLDAATQAAISQVVEAYDIELDQALRARQAAVAGARSDILLSLSQQDADASLQLMQRQSELHVRVREVNDRYIEEIAAALPAELSEEFRFRALELAYPRVYRDTPVQRIFRSAVKLDGLESSTLSSVMDVESQYLAELAVMNQRYLAALRQHEPEQILERARVFAMRMAGQESPRLEDPTREMSVERDELGRKFVRQLKGVLSAEHFQLLPDAARWIQSPSESIEKKPTSKNTSGNAKGKAKEYTTNPR